MERQPKPLEPLTEVSEEPLRVTTILESHNVVVRVADDDHVAFRPRLPPPVDPQVEHVVKVDIGQKRADAAALHRTHLTACPLPLFQHTRLQPLPYEAYDAPVSDAALDAPY